MNKTDLRVKKTKRLIRNSFVKLLAGKDLTRITVTDIVRLAEINRKTFYHHYICVQDVMDEIENEILERMELFLKTHTPNDILQDPSILFKAITEVIKEDYEFYSQILSMHENMNFFTKLIRRMRELYQQKEIAGPTSREEWNFILEYTFSGLFAIYRYWIQSDHAIPLEDLADLTERLCINGVRDFTR